MFSSIFCERLNELRTSKNLTMERLGEQVDATRGTISNYENGNKRPSLEMLIKLATYFDVSLDYLIGRTDNPLSHKKDD